MPSAPPDLNLNIANHTAQGNTTGTHIGPFLSAARHNRLLYTAASTAREPDESPITMATNNPPTDQSDQGQQPVTARRVGPLSAHPFGRTMALTLGAIVLTVLATTLAGQLGATDRTVAGQKKLRVDWTAPELKAFAQSRSAASSGDTHFAALRLPVMAFVGVPQFVRNVYGPDAKPTQPRQYVTDPQNPYFYNIEDTYGDISITVSADLRINSDAGPDAQFPAPNTATTPATAAKITVGAGADGDGPDIDLTFTIQKFPNIPYRVQIECGEKSAKQCKDLAVVAKDQSLLKVISLGKGQD
jgi:hypothetical protein